MSALPSTTTDAEGLPRRRFTFDDVAWMTRVGLLAEDERIELIGGELVPMSPKGSFHERMKGALTLHWARRLPAEWLFITETTFRLSPDTYLEPDFVVYPKASGWDGLDARTAQLVVEIADSSLSYDLGHKARLYAASGIVEMWVVDAVTRETRIHREPKGSGYAAVVDHAPGDRLVLMRVPELQVIQSELDLH